MVTIIVALIAALPSTIVAIIQAIKAHRNSVYGEIKSELKELKMDMLRMQIMNLIQHDPKNKSAILELYDIYKKMGGNSYIKELVQKWKKGQK